MSEQTEKPDTLEKYLGDGVEALTETTIVDVDVHVAFNANARQEVAESMDQPYKNYTLHDGRPSHGWPKSLGGKRPFRLIDVEGPEDIKGPLCDALGVDYPILNTLSGHDNLLKDDWAIEEMRATNDWMIDRFLDEDDDFYALLDVAMRDPHAVAEEIDRLGSEDQILGIMPSVCCEFNTAMGDPSYDVVYKALEDNDLTPVFHVFGIHRKAPVLREFDKTASWHTLGGKWSMEHTLTSLVFQGVPEKFPDLDFVMLEGGLGPWIPQLMARLNREYAQWRDELPMLEKSPEEYIRERFYFSSQPVGEFNDPDYMRQTIEMIGADSIMFASDHPHYDFDTPSTLDGFLSAFDGEEREQVLSGNAKGVFGI